MTPIGRMAYSIKTMSITVKVALGPRSYEIRIGFGLLNRIGEVCRQLNLGPMALVISDSHVDLQYGQRIERALEDNGFIVHREVVPAGESSKSPEQLLALYGRAVKAGLGRDGFVVALGGGVVGDLAGFFAATYLRGVTFVQVPTSLLAMVDSCVGGKTGINLTSGKNLVGAFYQPAGVLADVDTLRTLPRREFISGMAEVIKYGIIRDTNFFAEIEKHADAGLKPGWEGSAAWIARCCEIKADVVSRDERESGLRAILNFGHTLGHALEQVTGYSKWLHGEAVAIGMAYAAQVSTRVMNFPQQDAERIVALLNRVGLPTKASNGDWEAVRRAMSVDKKVRSSKVRWVLVKRIGEVEPGCEVGEEVLREVWEDYLV